jgi:hypothetical protein
MTVDVVHNTQVRVLPALHFSTEAHCGKAGKKEAPALPRPSWEVRSRWRKKEPGTGRALKSDGLNALWDEGSPTISSKCPWQIKNE